MFRKKGLQFVLLGIVLFSLVVGCSPLPLEPAGQARNVILLIGDGMGISDVELARRYSLHVLGRDLRMTEMMTEGELAMVTTHSASNLVTDSAASGTAIATGHKTNNGMLGVLPDGTPVSSILEQARDAGLWTGVLSTMRLSHATPGAFTAHNIDRNDENDIAIQMLESGTNVMMAGGWRNWVPQSVDGSKRQDDRDLIAEAQAAGYTVVRSASDLRAVDMASISHILGFFTKSHMNYEIDRDPAEEPSLAEMTTAALGVLGQNDKGFFLMVEGGRIDIAGHYSDVAALIHDMLAFDEAVGVALDYQAEHPDTLVLVTADHETGGVAYMGVRPMGTEGAEYMTNDDLDFISEIDGSLEVMITELAELDEDAVEAILEPHANVDLTEEEMASIMAALASENYYHDGQMAIGRAFAEETSVFFASGEHSGQPVLLLGTGPGSKAVHNLIDNTDIIHIIAGALGLE